MACEQLLAKVREWDIIAAAFSHHNSTLLAASRCQKGAWFHKQAASRLRCAALGVAMCEYLQCTQCIALVLI